MVPTADVPDQPTSEIALPARLDLAAAPSLREWYLEQHTDVVIDASDVEVVTTAGLQVMMAGRDWLQSQDFTVRLVNPTKAFLSNIATLGVEVSRLTTAPQPGGAA